MNFNIYNRNCSIRKSKLIVIYLRNERQEHAHLMNVQVKIISEIPFFIVHATAGYFYILNILFFVLHISCRCKALYRQYFMQFCLAILLRCKLKKKKIDSKVTRPRMDMSWDVPACCR